MRGRHARGRRLGIGRLRGSGIRAWRPAGRALVTGRRPCQSRRGHRSFACLGTGGPVAAWPRPSGIAFFGTRPPAQEYAPNGRYTLGKRTRELALGASEMGQSTKSLRDSPLRGDKSREAVASREESDSESTRSPRSTKLLLQRSLMRRWPAAGMTKLALTNSANQVA